MRIGIGYDVHRLVKGRKLVLGGVEIPYSRGLLGHSDGDALLHAIADAILGACGLGNIGEYFPDTKKEIENISSRLILKKIKELSEKNSFKVYSLDSILVLEEPFLSPFIPEMKKVIAEILEIPPDRVSIKPKRNEQMGFIGKKEGIAAQAVVIMEEK